MTIKIAERHYPSPDAYIHPCGIIIPNGEFYGCFDAEHYRVAREIKELYGDDALEGSLILYSSRDVKMEGWVWEPEETRKPFTLTEAQRLECVNILTVNSPDELRGAVARALLMFYNNGSTF